MITELALSVTGEQDIVDDVRDEIAWNLVEEFSSLVRDSGGKDERTAIDKIIEHLAEWEIPHTLHEPELLVSLPVSAELTVDGKSYAAKTPSLAASTGDSGLTALLTSSRSDVAGKVVLARGFPASVPVRALQQAGAVGVICISPGERIHEGICTSVWGSPDLTTVDLEPSIPAVSVSKPDGEALMALAEAGESQATLVAKHDTRWRPIPVLVAEIRGTVEPERFVLVHGHVDSWHVGIGDNATGDATLLELARVLQSHRDQLLRTVRIAWWSGHSHGRYAGSAWYADTFSRDIEQNCICHLNCDSPGCRDADAFLDVVWTPELQAFTEKAIQDFAGSPSTGAWPTRYGDLSFSNLGISTAFMLSSTISQELLAEKGLYTVEGCGGNIEWHTEADTIEVADRVRLLRDMRMYVGATLRAANLAYHPFDVTETVALMSSTLESYAETFKSSVDFGSTLALLQELGSAVPSLYEGRDEGASPETARQTNDAVLTIIRALNRVLYCVDGPYRQDPAGDAPLLPQLGRAAAKRETVHEGVIRTELLRARNRIESAIHEALAAVRQLPDAVPTS
jgi:N-acetylated-alpha-linked acidic dipeptidase